MGRNPAIPYRTFARRGSNPASEYIEVTDDIRCKPATASLTTAYYVIESAVAQYDSDVESGIPCGNLVARIHAALEDAQLLREPEPKEPSYPGIGDLVITPSGATGIILDIHKDAAWVFVELLNRLNHRYGFYAKDKLRKQSEPIDSEQSENIRRILGVWSSLNQSARQNVMSMAPYCY